MSHQPVSGDNWRYVGTAGTTVLSDKDVTLRKVILGGTYVGSIEFYDSATAAGTTAANRIFDLGLPLLNQYKELELNAQGTRGLTVVATGTPILMVTWGN